MWVRKGNRNQKKQKIGPKRKQQHINSKIRGSQTKSGDNGVMVNAQSYGCGASEPEGIQKVCCLGWCHWTGNTRDDLLRPCLLHWCCGNGCPLRLSRPLCDIGTSWLHLLTLWRGRCTGPFFDGTPTTKTLPSARFLCSSSRYGDSLVRARHPLSAGRLLLFFLRGARHHRCEAVALVADVPGILLRTRRVQNNIGILHGILHTADGPLGNRWAIHAAAVYIARTAIGNRTTSRYTPRCVHSMALGTQKPRSGRGRPADASTRAKRGGGGGGA